MSKLRKNDPGELVEEDYNVKVEEGLASEEEPPEEERNSGPLVKKQRLDEEPPKILFGYLGYKGLAVAAASVVCGVSAMLCRPQ